MNFGYVMSALPRHTGFYALVLSLVCNGCGTSEDTAPSDSPRAPGDVDVDTVPHTNPFWVTNGYGLVDCYPFDPDRQDGVKDLQATVLSAAGDCTWTGTFACRPLELESVTTSDSGCLIEPNAGAGILVRDSASFWQPALHSLNAGWSACSETQTETLSNELSTIAACSQAPPTAEECSVQSGGTCPADCIAVFAWPESQSDGCISYAPENAEVVACRSLDSRVYPAQDCWSRADDPAHFFSAITFEGATVADGWRRGCPEWDRVVPTVCE